LERHDEANRGKGHALNWALDRLPHLYDAADAIVILDADCEPSANLLESFDARLRNGAPAVQARYVVANPAAATSAALRFAAFALMNTVRPLGKDCLGLSCGLLGTGMAFRRSVLERHRFDALSLVEDSELHLRLVAAGERVVFAPEASVRSPMPTTGRASRTQQARWEGGRVELLRKGLPLLGAGMRQRDPVRLNAWLDHVVPPQSVLALMQLGFVALAAGARSRAGIRLAVVNTALHTIFVLGGLRLADAPTPVYRALAAAPVVIAQKVVVVAGILVSGAPRDWVRTPREVRDDPR
jgi:hypothetical protein